MEELKGKLRHEITLITVKTLHNIQELKQCLSHYEEVNGILVVIKKKVTLFLSKIFKLFVQYLCCPFQSDVSHMLYTCVSTCSSSQNTF